MDKASNGIKKKKYAHKRFLPPATNLVTHHKTLFLRHYAGTPVILCSQSRRTTVVKRFVRLVIRESTYKFTLQRRVTHNGCVYEVAKLLTLFFFRAKKIIFNVTTVYAQRLQMGLLNFLQGIPAQLCSLILLFSLLRQNNNKTGTWTRCQFYNCYSD